MEIITINTPQGTFIARATGDSKAPIVLCLHGFPDDATTFDSLGQRLAEAGFRAVAPYCRGYAPSPLTNPDGSDFGEDLFDVLSRDVLAIVDAISPQTPVNVIGHDNGAFTVYNLLNRAPEQFVSAATLTAGHPATVYPNTIKSPQQMWRSRYVLLFQVPGFADWWTQRNDFTYIERLWEDWSAPEWIPNQEHLNTAKQTLEKSWPAPLKQYRSGGFTTGKGWRPIPTPTLYLAGAKDGCVSPEIADGQEKHFSGPFETVVIEGAGHFLHLEKPNIVEPKLVEWVQTYAYPDKSSARMNTPRDP